MSTGEKAALGRALDSFKASLALLAGLYLVYQVPSAIAKDYELTLSMRLVLHVVALLFVGAIFAVLWGREAILDYLNDEPLPGFSRQESQALLRIAREVTPPVRQRNRNHVAISVGLGCRSLLVMHIIQELTYLSEIEVRQLRQEVQRERDIAAGEFSDISESAGIVSMHFDHFMDRIKPWLSVLAHLDDFPTNVRNDADHCVSLLNRVRSELNEMDGSVDSPNELRGRENRFKTLAEELQRAEDALIRQTAALRICATKCQNQISALRRWGAS